MNIPDQNKNELLKYLLHVKQNMTKFVKT